MNDLNLKSKSNIVINNIIGIKHKKFLRSDFPGLPPPGKYNRCNKGHALKPVYDYGMKKWVWDCPICIKEMAKERNVDWRQQYKWPEWY